MRKMHRLGMTRRLLAGLLMIATTAADASGRGAGSHPRYLSRRTKAGSAGGDQQMTRQQHLSVIQSWVENAADKRRRFVITPPLFAMQGKRIRCA